MISQPRRLPEQRVNGGKIIEYQCLVISVKRNVTRVAVRFGFVRWAEIAKDPAFWQRQPEINLNFIRRIVRAVPRRG
jgi:hypothetical protein